MEISASSLDGVTLLSVRGEIDHFTADAFEAMLAESLKAHDSPVVLDLSECSFMDSGGLNVLLLMVMRREGEDWLGVLGASPRLLRLFSLVGLAENPAFRVLNSIEDVLPRA